LTEHRLSSYNEGYKHTFGVCLFIVTNELLSTEKDTHEENGIAVHLQETSGKKLKRKKANTWYYMGVAGEIGFSVALPIAGGGILGSFLDSRWSTYPKMTLSFLFVGIILSVVNFIYVIKAILDREK